MLPATLASLRAHAGRLLAAGVAIVLGVAFVATTLILLGSVNGAVADTVAGRYRSADVVVTAGSSTSSGESTLTERVSRRVDRTRGVASAARVGFARARVSLPGDSGPRWMQVRTIPDDHRLRWQRMAGGRLPARTGEVAVDGRVAGQGADRVRTGDTLDVTAGSTSNADSHRARISGVVDQGSSLRGVAEIVTTAQTLRSWGVPVHPNEILVRGGGDVSPEQLRDRIAADLDGTGGDFTVATADKRAEAMVATYTGGQGLLGALLLGFAGVALFVAAIVIANTFTILLTQRTRELALLRCVGARRSQVFGSVLAESAVLALTASGFGLLAGLGLAAGAVVVLGNAGLLGVSLGGLSLSPSALIVPLVAGISVTMIAALGPARRATAVSPLAALRPSGADGSAGLGTRRSRAGYARRGLLAVPIGLLGAGGLLAGASQGNVLIGLVGGAAAFLAVLVASPVLVPPVLRLLGLALGRIGGVPLRLAVANLCRHPGRTAAVTASLLVGVTLISLLTVGESSSRQTVERALDDKMPLDVAVSTSGDRLPTSAVAALHNQPGLAAVVDLRGTTARVAPDRRFPVVAMSPRDGARVLRGAGRPEGLRAGSALVPNRLAYDLELADGDRLRLRTSEGTVAVTAHLSPLVSTSIMVMPPALDRLASHAPVRGIWARASGQADAGALAGTVRDAVADYSSVRLDGSLTTRAMYDQVFTALLAVATGLLAVAVLIALIGVGNTLSLSVIERTREQALLRALGLTKAGLRRMLAVESVLLAGVAAVAGIGLGVVFGWAGSAALLGSAADHLVYAVPVGRLGIIAAVALAAGLVAAVLPARRAARVQPAAALANE